MKNIFKGPSNVWRWGKRPYESFATPWPNTLTLTLDAIQNPLFLFPIETTMAYVLVK